jgi:hypothetical protein
MVLGVNRRLCPAVENADCTPTAGQSLRLKLFIRSFCLFKGLQGVSKAMARAEQAKSTAFALSKAFKVSQKPWQGHNKLNSQHLPFQRPSRCLKSHGKGKTS